MKKIIAYLFILTLLISCKSNITNIKLAPIENNKKWDYYYIGHKDSFSNKKAPVDSLYVFKPISFRLKNSTGNVMIIQGIRDNSLIGRKASFIVNNYEYIEDLSTIKLMKGEAIDITVFTHLPIPLSFIDKEYLDKLYTTGNKIKNDSIVLNSISPKLQNAIDFSFKKKYLTVLMLNKNGEEPRIGIFYCVYKQKVMVYDADSLYRANPRYKPDCN